ncbi:CCA tRNA nucleotidyltransferase [Candidatus Neomarinimicrobiota bacterium]
MANIRELIRPHKTASKLLTIAGELGQSNGLNVYVVGGFVRDLFLNVIPKEIDLMVEGDGIAFARQLANKLKVRKIVPFKEFGTAKIPFRKMEIEVASARQEVYAKSSRKPKQVKYTDLEGDLKRRDFTINAMAVNILPENFGDLYDPFKGIIALNNRKLVTPLSPNETFAEDPLRMLRAAYFASNLNLTIDPACYKSIIHQAERINIVSSERISGEIFKILKSPQPSTGLLILQETGLMKYIFPEIDTMVGLEQTKEWHHKDIFAHTMQVVDNAAKLSDKMEIRFAALVHDIAKPLTRRVDEKKGYTFYGHDDLGSRMIEKIAGRMRLSNELKKYLQKLTALHLRPIALAQGGVTDSAVRRLMVAAGEDTTDLMLLCRADITSKNPTLVKRYMGNFERVEKLMENVKERDTFRAFQSPVRGKEIMDKCGISEGKTVGIIKKEIEEAILDGKIDNTHAAALEYLLKIRDRFTD